MKNLALAVGVGLCLLCNINALTIWNALYTDQQLRATFSTSYAQKASDMAEAASKQESAAPAKPQLDSFKTNMRSFLTDVQFGVGRIWHTTSANGKPAPVTPQVFFYEFFGSLLTGILISIGAPYWHDLLTALSNLRSFSPAPKKS